MTGNIQMNGNDINGLTDLTVGSHILGATTYQSGTGGDSFLIRTSASTTASTPTYSFLSQTTTGMYTSTSDLRFTVQGVDRISINSSEIDVLGHRITNVATPTSPNDAANKNYVDTFTSVKLLGTASVDLTTTGITLVYTVPLTKMHVPTHIIFHTTSAVPGGAPTDPEVSVGTTALTPINILDVSTITTLGISTAGDQVYRLDPKQGAVSPNSGDVIRLEVTTAAGFTTLEADIIIIGLEI